MQTPDPWAPPFMSLSKGPENSDLVRGPVRLLLVRMTKASHLRWQLLGMVTGTGYEAVKETVPLECRVAKCVQCYSQSLTSTSTAFNLCCCCCCTKCCPQATDANTNRWDNRNTWYISKCLQDYKSQKWHFYNSHNTSRPEINQH